MPVITYKCPNCGGELKFDPGTQQYECEYCMSHFNQEEMEAANPQSGRAQEGRQEEKSSHASEEGAAVYTCPSCGAEIVTDDTTAATFCYYCHNPVVLSGRLSGEYLPDKVIPFAATREKAVEKFLEYVHKKKFVPRGFFSKDQIEKITGVYYPHWVYEARAEGQMSAEATNVRVWRGGDIEYTETSYYEIERAGSLQFHEYIRNALKKNDRTLAEGVQPFDVSGIKDFHMGYLSGFMAEKRDLEKKELQEEARQDIREFSEKLLRETISGYTSVIPRNAHIDIERESWEYVLLPVWVLTYRSRNGEIYYYTMNGQTEKICGKLPVDYGKLGILFLLTAGIVFLLGLLGGYLI